MNPVNTTAPTVVREQASAYSKMDRLTLNASAMKDSFQKTAVRNVLRPTGSRARDTVRAPPGLWKLVANVQTGGR